MERILIIEDDINIAELERDYLKLNGYAAEIETEGQPGLARALAGGFDVIIVDLMLPGKNGFDIIREIRERLEIPVLVVSAKSEDIDKIRGLDLGADDYITKPFSPAELAARVKSHIRRYQRLKGKGGAQDIVSHRGLEINTASHKVFSNGKEALLTAREYDLLLYLASNPNIVFTKEHLYETIWGQDFLGDTATVPVHIQKIRRKIEKNPSEPEYIETLWGYGYRFNA